MEHAIFLLLLCIPVVISNPCANQILGSQPYPGDCGAYIVCWLSMPYLKACPNNLLYDVNTNSCQPLHLSICCNVTFQATHQNIPSIPSVSTHSPNFTIPTLPPITETALPSSTTLDFRNTITPIDPNTQNITKLTTLSMTRLSTLESGKSATTQKSSITPVEIRPTTNLSLPLEFTTKFSRPVTEKILQKSTTGSINTQFITNLTPTISLSPTTTTTRIKSTLTDSPSSTLIEKSLTSTGPTIITNIVPTIVSLSPDLHSSPTTHSIQTPSQQSKITTVSTNSIKSTLIKKFTIKPSPITRPVTRGTVPTIEPSVTMFFTTDQAKTKFPSSTPFTTKLITIEPSSSIATKIPTTKEITTSSFEFTPLPLITTKSSASSSSFIHTSLNTEFITPTKLPLPPITDTSKFTTKKSTNTSVSTQTSMISKKKPYVSSTMPFITSITETSAMGTMTSESIISSTGEFNRPSLLPITNGLTSESTKMYQPTTIIEHKSSIKSGTILKPVTEPYITTTISNPMATKATILPPSTSKSILSPVTFTALETTTQALEPIMTTKRESLTERFTTSYTTRTTLRPEFTEPTITYESTFSPITMNTTKHKIPKLKPETKTKQFTTFNPITIVLKTTNTSPQSSTQSQGPSFVFTTRKSKTELTNKPARTEQIRTSHLFNTTFTSLAIKSSITDISHQSSTKPSFPPNKVKTIEPTVEILEPLTTERENFKTSYTKLTTLGPAITESNTTNTAFYSTIPSSTPSNIVTTEPQYLSTFSPTLPSISPETTNNSLTVPTDSLMTSTETIETLTSSVSQPEPISRPREKTAIFKTSSTSSIITSTFFTKSMPYITSTSSISSTPSESIITSKRGKNASRSTIPATISPRIPTSTKMVTTPNQSIFSLTTPTLSTLPRLTAKIPISTPIDRNTSVSNLPTISSSQANQTSRYSTFSTILTNELIKIYISKSPSTSSKYESSSNLSTSYDRNTINKTTTISLGQLSKSTISPTTILSAENITLPSTSNTKFIVTEPPTYRPYPRPTTVENIPSITDYFSKIYKSTTLKSLPTKLAKPTLPPISTTVYIPPCHTTPKPNPTITKHPNPLPGCRLTDRFLYPDLANCSSYYKCFYGTVRKLKCKYGYQFNPRALKCMPRIEANCRIMTDLNQQQAFLSEYIHLHNLLQENL